MKRAYERVVEINRGDSQIVIWAHEFEKARTPLTAEEVRLVVWMFILWIRRQHDHTRLRWNDRMCCPIIDIIDQHATERNNPIVVHTVQP
jgi:hypothetical protein